MSQKFSAGDLVRLKTGSQTMTVKGIATKPITVGTVEIPHRYACYWSDGKKVQQAIFHEDTLELA